jgi:hypothetical protein
MDAPSTATIRSQQPTFHPAMEAAAQLQAPDDPPAPQEAKDLKRTRELALAKKKPTKKGRQPSGEVNIVLYDPSVLKTSKKRSTKQPSTQPPTQTPKTRHPKMSYPNKPQRDKILATKNESLLRSLGNYPPEEGLELSLQSCEPPLRTESDHHDKGEYCEHWLRSRN